MYQPEDAALLRAAAYPGGLALPAWPDLTAAHPEEWLAWLGQAWALPGFAAAVTPAAPHLAAQITRALTGQVTGTRKLQRLTEAAVRYLLRWTTRATPFGRFAGAAPAELGERATLTWGGQHQAVTRPDDLLIAEHVATAEQDVTVLRAAQVMTNTLGYPRGVTWVVPRTGTGGGRMQDTEISLTGPIRMALETARTPARFAGLAADITRTYPAAAGAAERLLASLVQAGALLSSVRPPMTVTGPAAWLARHLTLPGLGTRIATDLRLDCTMTLPPAVAREACRAACALARTAPPLPGWAAYHAAYIERWGPGAAVPLREVLRVLGFPAGYLGSEHRVRPAFTARDRLLAGLAQQSALGGCAEVTLDDDLTGQLGGDGGLPPVPHTELRFTLAARTLQDLDRGAFTLTVVSGARHAGVAAARFLHLLTPPELERFRRVYTSLPARTPGADIVQLSAPPLDTRLAGLSRTPELLPVLPAGDFHPAPPRSLTDLAVAADGQRLWLVSVTTGRAVEPLLLSAVLLPGLQQPLVRFLTEIWTAWTAQCARFDWGHARSLPFLPRIRRGRSILHPARWLISQADLPGRTASWTHWHTQWKALAHQRHLPSEVFLGDGDQRLRISLDEAAHLAVLRSELGRHGRAALTEADDAAGWAGGRPAEILLTLTRAGKGGGAPARPARPASTICSRPGSSRWLEARLYGRCDDILSSLSGPAGIGTLPAGWWFIRYPHPQPHVRLRIPLRDPADFAGTARDLARWTEQLDSDGLLTDCALHTYRPETRHGTGPVLAAAEAVFAADSRAALRALTLPPAGRQAAAAAMMITIADAFTGDGMSWLAGHVPPGTGPRLSPGQLAQAGTRHDDPCLAAALTGYRALLGQDGLDADQVLADLLHLHHARVIGVDTASERHCLRLARAAARTALARRTA